MIIWLLSFCLLSSAVQSHPVLHKRHAADDKVKSLIEQINFLKRIIHENSNKLEKLEDELNDIQEQKIADLEDKLVGKEKVEEDNTSTGVETAKNTNEVIREDTVIHPIPYRPFPYEESDMSDNDVQPLPVEENLSDLGLDIDEEVFDDAKQEAAIIAGKVKDFESEKKGTSFSEDDAFSEFEDIAEPVVKIEKHLDYNYHEINNENSEKTADESETISEEEKEAEEYTREKELERLEELGLA